MDIVFFDYYHPYAGLCNQLYLITNHIHRCYTINKQIYIHKFNLDIFKKNRVSIKFVLDIETTNKNLKRLTGKNILASQPPEIISSMQQLCIYPVSSIEILNCLAFNQDIVNLVETIKYRNLDYDYYGIHFRLDIDAILHYTFGKEIYNKYMDLSNQDTILAEQFFETLNKNKIESYCNFLIQQYIRSVEQFGFDKIWYICTSLLKWDIHEYFVKYLEQLTGFILKNGGKFFISSIYYNERELNALVDLLVLRDCKKMVGFEGSSFSEGYCFKVNQIRKVTQEFIFVKEYP